MKKILALVLALSLMLMTAVAFADGSQLSSPAEITIGGTVTTGPMTLDDGYGTTSENGFQIAWDVTPAVGTNSNEYFWNAAQQKFVAKDFATTWTNPSVTVTITNYGTSDLKIGSSFVAGTAFDGLVSTTDHWNISADVLDGFDASAAFMDFKADAFVSADAEYDSDIKTFGFNLYGRNVEAGSVTIGSLTITAAY